MAGDAAFQPVLEAEVAVLGGGGAGLAAAVAAAEKGARVLVVEKRKDLGGNSAMAEGLFAAESSVQKRLNIDARREHLFRVAMAHSHWKLNPRIIRAFIDKSADTIEWLQDKGLSFDCVPYYPNQIPVWHCFEGGGIKLARTMVKNCRDLGVTLLNNTAAKEILTDQNRRVTGVRVAAGGKAQTIVAKSVIIATGGYGGNKKLLKKYCPFYTEDMFCQGLPHMGDGLSMAMTTGAATEGLGILQLGGPGFIGSSNLRAIAREPDTVWVNNRGERYIDEAVGFIRFESANALLRQPGKISYSLFDEGVKKSKMEVGVILGTGLVISPHTRLSGVDREMKSETARDMVKIAGSWDEIAEWIGARPEVLKATINEYNADCDDGYDRIFAKPRQYLAPLRTPPYYALQCHANFLSSIGGIKINHRMEVLDCEDNPIPGLYAGGLDAGGWETETYNVELAGAALGFAINSGRIAGENAVKYARGTKHD